MKRVLFYSSVTDKKLFHIQQFYQIDIRLLEEMGYEVLLSNSIYDAWKFWKYNFVFAYFYKYSFFVALIAKIFGKPIFFTGGIDKLDLNWASAKEKRIQQFFFYLCYILSTKCIIVSQTDMKNVQEIVHKNTSKLYYSEHTINTNAYKDANLCDKESMFVTILWQGAGNIYRKGADLALKIYSKMIKDGYFQDSKFIIIGMKEKGTPVLEKMIKDLGIENRVSFTDAISEKDKVNYLKRSKYYIQLSKYEGFGLAPLEALCAKNIVIHSGKGGLSNPIYNFGVKYNIEKDFSSEYKLLMENLEKYNDMKLEEAHNLVNAKYCHARRLNDFKSIIKV